jgi:hypothetical protein
MDNNFGLSLLNELTHVDQDSDVPDDVAMHHFDSPVKLPTDLPTAGMTSKQHKTLDAHLCVHSLSRSEFYMQISQIAPDLLGPDAPLRAHTDGGSMATTTNRREYLWDYRELSPEERRPVLRVADSRAHHPVGIGFLRVPTTDNKHGYHPARCFYTPSLPATILSPSAMAREHQCSGGYTTTFTFHGKDCSVNLIHDNADKSRDIVIPQVLIHDLLFTLPLLRNPDSPDCRECTLLSQPLSSETSLGVSALTQDQLRVLWHQRLGHMHSRRVATAYKYADGVPKVAIASALESCPVCMKSKLRKAARHSTPSRRATRANQGIAIDFGFVVQESKTQGTSSRPSTSSSSRKLRLQGMHGETCYCLITDHFSGYLYGECFQSKAPPLDFLNRWLAQYGLPRDVPDKYVRFDQGGELGRCAAIVNLFENAGYRVETTAPDSSHQNGPGERPHQTIADAMRTMLSGASLDMKFWPYAFHHFLRIYNSTVHGDHDASPFELCSGSRPNLSLLRVFGCRVYALPARPRRPDKLISDARTGIFLGYAKSMKNILYFDSLTETVKTAQHVAFDEAMNDLPEKPPNAQLLGAVHDVDPDQILLDSAVANFDISISPFADLVTLQIQLDVSAAHPLGFEFSDCSHLHRAFIHRINRPGISFSLATYRRRFLGSYIVSVNDVPTFSSSSIQELIDDLCRTAPDEEPPIVNVTLAPERKSDVRASGGSPLHLRLHDLRHICALRSVSPTDQSTAALRQAVASFENMLSDHDLNALLHRLQTDCMTDEERKLTRFTRRNLKKLSNWPEWDAAFDAQLDAHYAAGALGLPVPRPSPTSDGFINILRIIWSNVVKPDGKRKCRACIDGSRRAAPWLHLFAQTYASCIEQPCMRLFFALAAIHCLIITFGDTTNAFQQSPPPTRKCYLRIDDAYASWYYKRFGILLDRSAYVIPVERALQGHPEAGRLWETMIVEILSKKGFKSTTHERNLYYGFMHGTLVLVCRQVDDYAIASASSSIADELIAFINSHVTTTNHGTGSPSASGITSRYNGLNIHQTSHYIKLSCEVYLKRVLQTHGWETPSARESDRHDCVPLSSDAMSALALLSGPPETDPAHAELERQLGYGY